MRKSRLTEEQMMADLKEWLASFGRNPPVAAALCRPSSSPIVSR